MGEAENISQRLQGFCQFYPIKLGISKHILTSRVRFDSRCTVDAAPWAGTIG